MSRSWEMRLIHLLSSNDLDALSSAMRRMEPVTLTRALGDTEVTASVVPAGKAWPVAMLVRVRVKRGRTEWVQHFESVEGMRGAAD